MSEHSNTQSYPGSAHGWPRRFRREAFVLERFFTGRTVAHAQFVAITGLRRRFRIDIEGIWENGTLELRESFTFDDGETDRKTWKFRKIEEGRYEAERDDIVRPVEATIRGDRLRYTYLLFLDPARRSNVVRFWDRIFMVDAQRLKNFAIVLKFGVPVGIVTGEFRKID